MTEPKKLYDATQCRMCGFYFVPKGWVKAEPTDCEDCCYMMLLSSAGWCCRKTGHKRSGLATNEICLDFKPKQGDKK
jgi:hypothetical protein